MILVSFDPASYKNCGYATLIINDGKVISCSADTFVVKKSSSEEPWKSCWPIYRFVNQYIKQNKPDVVIVEKTSSFSMGFVTGQISSIMGVIFAVCGKYNLPVEFKFPTHVKKVITGKGKATKSEMKKAVKKWLEENNLNTEMPSEHAADAVANIICYLKEKNS